MHGGVGSFDKQRHHLKDASKPSNVTFQSFISPIGIVLVGFVLFQFASGELTVAALVLQVIVYVSFVLICFLFGCFGLLSQESPTKSISFDNSKNTPYVLDVFNKTLVSNLSVE